ncbi:MAG: hypothetical protein SF028_06015 [Candidatus Sumerlaeia bacterium]|nr:hypothetical protein [Candidatus Sumerlaeia bacterium]
MIQPVPFFETDYFIHDLRRGTVHNRSKTKLCFMPSEFLLALKQVLEEETGDAWREIMLQSGRIWGKRVAKRFHKEMSDFYGRPLHELPTREFMNLLEAFFRYHGWGLLTIDLQHAEHGYIVAKLENSAFVEITGPSRQPVDMIVAGLLGQFIAHVSERPDVECVETACSATGAPHCMFLVGIAARLQTARNIIAEGGTHEDVLAGVLPMGGAFVSDSDTEQLNRRG